MTTFTVLTVIGIAFGWVAWRRRLDSDTQYVSVAWRNAHLRERR
jgi:hypothetical protein